MKSHSWLWILVLLAMPQLAGAETFRLMLVGDSITEGQGAPPGFRDDLYTLLNADPDNDFLFVGSMGAPPLQGHFLGGREIEDFYPQSFGYGWGNGTFDTTPDLGPPDTPSIVAIHLGTNDLNSQLPPFVPYSFDHGQTLTHTHLGELADYLRFLLQWRDGTQSSDLQTFVLSLNIPMQGRAQDVRDWVNGIIAMSEDFGEGLVTGSPLRLALADHYHRFIANPNLFTFGPGDWMSDALHPNDTGYIQMADIYHQAIAAAVSDTIPPSPIVDLAVIAVDTTSVDLSFTAVGDDGLVGRAFRYDLRVATSPINDIDFAFAPQALDEPAPRAAWEADTLHVHNLLPGTNYYFAVKVVDQAGNRSPISNIRNAMTIGSPTVILTLRNGLNGYNGTEDNHMIDARPNENVGASTAISVGKHGTVLFGPEGPAPGSEIMTAWAADPGDLVTDTSRSLIRFDLSQIPAGVDILDARLRLYGFNRDSSTPVEIAAYRVTKPWVEGTRATPSQQTGASCWEAAQLSILPWSAPGAAAASNSAQNNDPNWDRFESPESTAIVSANDTWYEWNLTNAVMHWANGSWSNDGVLLQAVDEFGNSRHGFYSSEAVVNQNLRPMLVVTFAADPANAPPIADAGGPYEGEEDLPIQFDGTGSFDPEGLELTYAWDFGDGITGTGPTPTHAYADPGSYTARLVVHDGQASSEPDEAPVMVSVTTGIGDPAAAPIVTRLLGAMPNPVAPTSALRYDLAQQSHVTLRIADVHGRIVRVLVDGIEEAGQHRVQWNAVYTQGERLAAGIYFLHLEAAGVNETRKLIVLP